MIQTIVAKELRALFTSPLAWVILAFLQIILAWIFLTRVDYFLTIQPQLARVPNAPGLSEIVVVPMFGIASIVLLMSVPLLTMRLIAEERRNRTMTMLMSACAGWAPRKVASMTRGATATTEWLREPSVRGSMVPRRAGQAVARERCASGLTGAFDEKTISS